MDLVNPRDKIIEITPKNPFGRLPDGRPHVPDSILERMRLVTTEEAWTVVARRHGYHYQFEGGWWNPHLDHVLVGRAVTAKFVPVRPDLQEVVETQGQVDGRVGGQNSWVIDTLLPGDVIVVDLFGKVKDGTFAGDNLSTSINAKTGTGMVIDGGMRDTQRVLEIAEFGIFVRGVHPTAIADVTLVGINIPIRIGNATVLPGDVVLGTRSGVMFIPPHLAHEVLEYSEDIRLRDQFGHQRLREGRWTPGEIDRPWTPDIEGDFAEWRKARHG